MDNEIILPCSKEQLENELRDMILTSLEKQGFIVQNGNIFLPDDLGKEKIRKMHNEAIACKIERAKKGLRRHEDHLLSMLASGAEVVPKKIEPRLQPVIPGTEEELMFRYLSLHWSIPVSSGYGRRLSFLVIVLQRNSKVSGAMGTVRASPKRSEGPKGRRWNCPRGVAGTAK
jgi:hypothetical protein